MSPNPAPRGVAGPRRESVHCASCRGQSRFHDTQSTGSPERRPGPGEAMLKKLKTESAGPGSSDLAVFRSLLTRERRRAGTTGLGGSPRAARDRVSQGCGKVPPMHEPRGLSAWAQNPPVVGQLTHARLQLLHLPGFNESDSGWPFADVEFALEMPGSWRWRFLSSCQRGGGKGNLPIGSSGAPLGYRTRRMLNCESRPHETVSAGWQGFLMDSDENGFEVRLETNPPSIFSSGQARSFSPPGVASWAP
ncbi:hypothetical protein VTI74DRAFT_9963 [Chaetomium olivicolor]